MIRAVRRRACRNENVQEFMRIGIPQKREWPHAGVRNLGGPIMELMFKSVESDNIDHRFKHLEEFPEEHEEVGIGDNGRNYWTRAKCGCEANSYGICKGPRGPCYWAAESSVGLRENGTGGRLINLNLLEADMVC